MSYSDYFFTGILLQAGGSFIVRFDGEFVGSYSTWAEAKSALKAAQRRYANRKGN